MALSAYVVMRAGYILGKMSETLDVVELHDRQARYFSNIIPMTVWDSFSEAQKLEKLSSSALNKTDLTTNIQGAPIYIGYDWAQAIEFEDVSSLVELFPYGSLWTSHGKYDAASSAPDIQFDVSLVDKNRIDLIASSSLTALLRPGTLLCDLVRTDIASALYGHIEIEIDVIMPITHA